MDYLKTFEVTENKKRLHRRKSMLMGKASMILTGILLIVGLLAGCGGPEPTKEIYNTKAYIEYNLDKWAADIFNTVYESTDKSSDYKNIDKIPLSGETILAYYHKTDDPCCNVYCKYNMPGYVPNDKDLIPESPFFLPVVSNGDPVIPDVPESAQAEYKEKCEYLIVYGGFESGRIEGYYQGNIDRVSTKTVVYVIDPQKEKLLLRKTIGTNSPGDVTSTPTGQVMHDQAKDYIAHLFEDQQNWNCGGNES